MNSRTFWLTCSGVAILIAALSVITPVFLGNVARPFIMAAVFNIMAQPLIHLLKKRRIAPLYGLGIFYILCLLFGFLVVSIVIPSVSADIAELIELLPLYAANLTNRLNIVTGGWDTTLLVEAGRKWLENEIHSAVTQAAGSAVALLSAMSQLVIAIILSFYFIMDRDRFKAFSSIIPLEHRDTVVGLIGDWVTVVSSFVRGKLCVSIVWGVTIGLLLSYLQVRFAVIIAFACAIVNMVPYLGPIFAAIPVIIASAIVSPINIIWVAISFLLIELLEKRYVKTAFEQHPIITILAVLCGANAAGLWGIIFAIPIFAMVTVSLKRFVHTSSEQKQ